MWLKNTKPGCGRAKPKRAPVVPQPLSATFPCMHRTPALVPSLSSTPSRAIPSERPYLPVGVQLTPTRLSELIRSHLSRKPVWTPPLKSDSPVWIRSALGTDPLSHSTLPSRPLGQKPLKAMGHFIFNSAAPQTSEST